SFTDGSERAAKSDAHGVGRSAAAARKDVARFVHEDAFRFCAAAIEPENVAHNQSIREAGHRCARAEGEVLKGLRARGDWPDRNSANLREKRPDWWRPPHHYLRK